MKQLRILHFNDVYNVEEREAEPCGGASRFKTLLNRLRGDADDGLVTFGGDAMNPSTSAS